MATLISGLGGTAGYGENTFSTSGYTGNLDDGSINVSLNTVFGASGVNLYGTTYTSVYINTNGLLTFGAAEPGYTPAALTTLGQPSVAPFWTDIDISKGGEIYWDLDATTGKLTVTWLNVAPYSGTGTNSFQAVLTNLGGGDVNIEYIYGSIGFTNGGFGEATVGISNGTSSQTLVEGSGDGTFLATYAGNDFDTNDPAGVFSLGYENGTPFAGDGIVDGTAGGDLINSAYVGDPDTDRIDAQDATGYAGTVNHDDYVVAGAGNDTVQSGLGNDQVYGGADQDQITLAQGNDWADGGTENDSIDGGSGNDTTYGGEGDDSLYGGADSTATTYTAAYTEVTGASQQITGSSGRPNFRVTTQSNETLTTGSNGVVTGWRLGDVDSNETHTHTASSQIAGGRIIFNGVSGSETLTIRLDGVTQNISTLIANGQATFSGGTTYSINGSGQIIRTGSGGTTTTTGTLTITAPYTSIQLVSTGTTTNAGLWYEYYANTAPANVAAATGGNDVLYGDLGNDLIYGGNGNDSLYGGDNSDTVHGDAGDDWADLGAGDDLFGTWGAESAGNDIVYGGTGNDIIYGGGENDQVYGGAGNDSLSGGAGNDTLNGGDDADTFWITDDHNGDTIVGGEGGNDNDTVAYANWATTQGVNVTFTGNEAGTYAYIAAGGATGSFTEIEAIVGTDYADNLNAAASGAAQTLYGQGGVDSLAGGSANDTLYGGNDGDSINGNGGADSVFGDLGNDFLDGGAGSDTLYGGDGEDLAAGGADNDTVYGDAGGDTLSGNANDDLIYGGLGDDRTGYGADNEAGNDTVYGDAGNDSLGGGLGNDQLYGGDDNDTLAGDDGNDTLLGEAGADALSGGAGTDSLDGGIGNDNLSGGADADTLFGGANDDILAGDAGADLLFGGDGNDALTGGTDNDTLTGGTGADTLNGGQGMDYADYTASDAGVTADVNAGSASGGHGAGDVLNGIDGLLGSAYGDTFYGFDAFSTNPADSYTNIFFGNDGADYLDGRGGDDFLYGGADADTVLGGAGADVVEGGAGADSLNGGAGADTIDGGADADTIVVGGGTEPFGDAVAGGETGTDNDTLDLTAWGWSLTNVIYDSGNPENGTVEFLDGAGAVIGSMTFSGIEQVIPCFTPGTLITTDRGDVAVEDLQAGDMVMTRDNGLQPLRWIGRRELSMADLIVKPNLRPVQISAGALGYGLPLRDMKVSPQHRMLIEGARAEMLFGEPEVLVTAKHLCVLPGVAEKMTAGVSYIHLLLDRHEIICADGAWTESFQPAMRMLDGMDAEQRTEIAELFPELMGEEFDYPAARLSLKAHEARVLLAA